MPHDTETFSDGSNHPEVEEIVMQGPATQWDPNYLTATVKESNVAPGAWTIWKDSTKASLSELTALAHAENIQLDSNADISSEHCCWNMKAAKNDYLSVMLGVDCSV